MIRFLLMALSLYFPMALKAEATVPIAPGKQTGLITFHSESALDRAASDVWMKFCKRLGRELSYPGPGFLSSTTCQPADAPRPSASRGWQLEIIEGKRTFELKLQFLTDGASLDIQSLSFSIDGPVLEHLESDVLPVALARMLVETNPTGRAYRHSEGGPSFSTHGEPLPFPQDLLVYRLNFDKKEGLWIPILFAHISKVKDHEAEDSSDRVVYEIDQSYRPLQIGKAYWVRGLDHEERQSKYQAIVTGALQGKSALSQSKGSKRKKSEKNKNFIDDYLLGSLRSSYAGFRYGKSIAKSDSIVTQLSMISVLAEIGDGPLAGLRGYYDLFPELRRGSGSNLEYFELRRAWLSDHAFLQSRLS